MESNYPREKTVGLTVPINVTKFVLADLGFVNVTENNLICSENNE
jgi:hypothetical protein